MKNFKTLALALTIASITLPSVANAAKPCINFAVGMTSGDFKKSKSVRVQYAFWQNGQLLPGYNETYSVAGANQREWSKNVILRVKAEILNNNYAKYKPFCPKAQASISGNAVLSVGYQIN